jgi:hypothetical protein
MTIIAEQRLENVVASILKYVTDNYSLTGIKYPRSNFKVQNVDEWIAVDILSPERMFKRQTSPGKFGSINNLIININYFAKRSFLELGDKYRSELVRDTLHDLFKERTSIPIHDHVDTGSLIGSLECMDIENTNIGLDSDSDSYQYNTSVRGMYIEERT